VSDGIDKQHPLQGDLGGAAVVTETLATPATMMLQNKARNERNICSLIVLYGRQACTVQAA